MAKLYYIPLEIGPWLQDTSCIDMDTQGCLLNILFKLWDSKDKGRLCFAFDQLSFLLKRSPEDCKKVVEKIDKNGLLNVIFQQDGSVILESRKMLRDAHNSQIKSENGKKGGRPPKNKKANQKQKESEIKANSDYDSHYDSHSISEKGKRGTGKKPKAFIPEIPESWNATEFYRLWNGWIEARTKSRKPPTEYAKELALKDLIEYFPNWIDAKLRLEGAIKGGWAGLVFKDDKEPIKKALTPTDPGYYDDKL